MKKLSVLMSVLFLLSGCEIIRMPVETLPEEISAHQQRVGLCNDEEERVLFGAFCEIDYWAEFFVANAEIAWPERKVLIEALDDSPQQMMQKILLSQYTDTPYRFRLRAQNWISNLQQQVPRAFSELLEIAVYNPSQQLLEMESAITILSRVNSEQEKEMEAQQALLQSRQAELEKQRQQVEQLLKIEANMVDQSSSQNNKGN